MQKLSHQDEKPRKFKGFCDDCDQISIFTDSDLIIERHMSWK